MRTVYKFLLRLHPPAFRRQFAAEMLWIFDEAAKTSGAPALVADGFISLIRQWVLRSGAWKLAVVILGAALQVTAGGLIWLASGHAPAPPNRADPAMTSFIRFILWSTGTIVLMVAAASIWVGRFLGTRNHAS
jgi:hypothetical protein